MTRALRLIGSIALAVSLSGCIYGHPYHRHWNAPIGGRPGYWR